jgi:hypothetical protein
VSPLGTLKGAPLRCSLAGTRWSCPGLLVTGEAAGSTYAFTGEGIGKAMETGLLAADALGTDSRSTDADTRARYEASLRALQPRFALYQRAEHVNRRPWLADLVIWRARPQPGHPAPHERRARRDPEPRPAAQLAGHRQAAAELTDLHRRDWARRPTAASAGRRMHGASPPSRSYTALAMSSRPLSEGNALQRGYAAWAAGHYARMPEPVRSEAQRIDRWLYSRSGLVFWLGLLSALAASAVGLAAAGLPVWLAVLASLFVWGALALGLLGAWMAPDRFEARRLARVALLTSAFAYLGALAGFLAGRMARHGSLVTETLPEALARAAWQATPILLALVAGVFALMWGVAQLKGVHLQREMAALELVRERDSAARQASEAQLRLLQAQIQPHFIFNTLATGAALGRRRRPTGRCLAALADGLPAQFDRTARAGRRLAGRGVCLRRPLPSRSCRRGWATGCRPGSCCRRNWPTGNCHRAWC